MSNQDFENAVQEIRWRQEQKAIRGAYDRVMGALTRADNVAICGAFLEAMRSCCEDVERMNRIADKLEGK